jgi:hypothetical protein
MKFLALLLASSLFSFSAFATSYTIPATALSDSQKTQLVETLHQFGLQDGKYSGHSPSGEVCTLSVDSLVGALDLISGNYGRVLLIEIPSSEYRHTLLDFSQTAETASAPATLHLAYVQNQTEREGFIGDLHLTAQKGQLTSYQLSTSGPHGGSNIVPGEVYDSSYFYQVSDCNGLVRH